MKLSEWRRGRHTTSVVLFQVGFPCLCATTGGATFSKRPSRRPTGWTSARRGGMRWMPHGSNGRVRVKRDACGWLTTPWERFPRGTPSRQSYHDAGGGFQIPGNSVRKEVLASSRNTISRFCTPTDRIVPPQTSFGAESVGPRSPWPVRDLLLPYRV